MVQFLKFQKTIFRVYIQSQESLIHHLSNVMVVYLAESVKFTIETQTETKLCGEY